MDSAVLVASERNLPTHLIYLNVCLERNLACIAACVAVAGAVGWPDTGRHHHRQLEVVPVVGQIHSTIPSSQTAGA